MVHYIVVFGVLTTSLAIVFADDYPCQWNTSNATYDLCRLQLKSSGYSTESYYEVFDNSSSVLYNFTYIFNVCNDVESKPPDDSCYNDTIREKQFLPMGYCPESEINETNGECLSFEEPEDKVAAYQIKRGAKRNANGSIIDYNECYRLHDGVEDAVFSYLDPQDPSTGVKITYINGDWCEAVHRNREFTLEFYCSELLENVPDRREEVIYEDETCRYTLPIQSSFGCPSECGISSNFQLCDGHGVCEFDFTNERPQCFCYWGYCGDDCSNHDPDACASELYNITNDVPKNDEESCLFELTDANGLKVWYNLSAFDLKDENFIVDDDEDREYVYKFNICGNLEGFEDVEEFPSSCRDYNHGPCSHVDSEGGTCVNDYDTLASHSIPKAVQIYTPENVTKVNASDCWWLGMDLPEGFERPSYEVSLIDAEDAGRGVVYKIKNGEKCDEGKRNRELNVRLKCPDTRVSEFDPEVEAQNVFDETVLESETCRYELELESPLACPLQCINEADVNPTYIGDGKLYRVCSSHGICASDPVAKQVRCICDDGFEGMTCEQKSGEGNDDNNNDHHRNDADSGEGANGNGIGIAIAVCVILLMLGVVGGWFYLQRRKKVINAYGDLMSDGGLIQEEVSE